MRRLPFALAAAGAAALLLTGCSSSLVVSHDSRPVSLAGGDRLGARIHRETPEFAVVTNGVLPASIASADDSQ